MTAAMTPPLAASILRSSIQELVTFTSPDEFGGARAEAARKDILSVAEWVSRQGMQMVIAAGEIVPLPDSLPILSRLRDSLAAHPKHKAIPIDVEDLRAIVAVLDPSRSPITLTEIR